MYQFHYEYIGTKYNNSTKFYLQTQIMTQVFFYRHKLNQIMFMKTFMKIKVSLIFVTILKIF